MPVDVSLHEVFFLAKNDLLPFSLWARYFEIRYRNIWGIYFFVRFWEGEPNSVASKFAVPLFDGPDPASAGMIDTLQFIWHFQYDHRIPIETNYDNWYPTSHQDVATELRSRHLDVPPVQPPRFEGTLKKRRCAPVERNAMFMVMVSGSQGDNSHSENHLVLFAGTPSPPPKKSSYPWAVDGQNPANQFIWKKNAYEIYQCFVYPQSFSQIPSTWMPISGCNWNKTLQREPSTVLVGNTLGNDEQSKSHGTDNNELRVKSDAYNLPKKYLTKNHDTSSCHQPTNQTNKPNKPNQPTIPFLYVAWTKFHPNSNTAPQRPLAATSPSPAQAVAQQVLLARDVPCRGGWPPHFLQKTLGNHQFAEMFATPHKKPWPKIAIKNASGSVDGHMTFVEESLH